MLQHRLSASLLVPFTRKYNGGYDLVTPHHLLVKGSIFLFTTVVYLALLLSSNSEHMSDSLYLAHPTSEMTQLRQLLAEQKYFPSHRTWERQMFAIPATLPAQIDCEARHLVSLIHQWASGGHR